MKHDPAILNLLLRTAYLRHERGTRAALAFEAWQDVTLEIAPEPKMPTPRAALSLLRAACQLCNAAGVDAPDMVQEFNNSREARMGAADLDTALAAMAESVLLFTMVRAAEQDERKSA